MNKYYLCGAINYRDMDKDIFLAKIERRYRLYLYPFALLSFDAMLQKFSFYKRCFLSKGLIIGRFRKKDCIVGTVSPYETVLYVQEYCTVGTVVTNK